MEPNVTFAKTYEHITHFSFILKSTKTFGSHNYFTCNIVNKICLFIYFYASTNGALLKRFSQETVLLSVNPFMTNGKVQVGKDQEKAQSEKDSHSKNRGGKKPN